MLSARLLFAGLLGALSLATAACTGRYGYSGAGLGSGYYGDPSFASGYGSGYYGWYGDYYYPGTGSYVFDRGRRAYAWNDGQRRYWEQRRHGMANRDVRANWRDFGQDVRRERREYRGAVRTDRQAYRDGRITRERFRQERRSAGRDYRQDVRRDYRELRRGNRAEGYRTPRNDRAFPPRSRR